MTEEDRLLLAVSLAAKAHAGQTDKGGAAYILHPLRVAANVPSGDARIAAILHDVVEDGDVSVSDLQAQFGSKVADAVAALTRGSDETYEAFIERCSTNSLAVVVKLADLADNMDLSRLRGPATDADNERLQKYERARKTLVACPAFREHHS